MRKILVLLISLYSLAASTAWAHTINAPTSQDKAIVISKAKPTFKIHLPSNPYIGGAWFIKEWPAKVLELKQHSYMPPIVKALNVDGTETFEFKVLKTQVPQIIILKLEYLNPWYKGKDKVKEKSASFKIIILGVQEDILKTSQFRKEDHDQKIQDIKNS